MKIPCSLELLENRIAPAGIVTMDYNEATGELVLTGDDASNAIDIFQVAPGVFRIEGKEDADTQTNTSIDEVGNGATTITKLTKLTINLGGGNDEVDLANLRTLKSLSVNAGIGNDNVEGYNIIVSGDVSFDTGTGADIVELSGASTVFGRDLVVSDSEGGIVFEFGAASSVVRGQVTFNGGAGSDVLSTAASTSLTIGKSITFNGGSGGANSITFGDQGTIKIGRSATGQSVLFTGSSGADTISIGANTVAIKGSVEMTGGDGANVVDIDGVRVSIGRSLSGASVLLTGGNNSDEIDIQGANVKASGSLKLNGGGGADFFDLTNVNLLSVAGAIELNGGSGEDNLAIEANSLKLANSVRMVGGDDTDQATIEGDGFIKGPVELLLGNAVTGSQTMEIRGLSGLSNSLKLQSGLTVDTGGAVASDIFRLTNVTIAKPTSLLFGNGASDVDIDNMSVAATLAIDTRGGGDSVRIETDAVYGVAQFSKATTISLGEGNDVLRIGQDSGNNRVSVLSSLTVDGGAGTDTRNDIEEDNRFSDAATFSANGFETEDLT